MIVKNPTGITINYAFASLTLTPGETAEIDNSYIENLDFQIAQEGGTISVVKYEKDYTYNTVTIAIGTPPTSPNINQKGGLVAANNPSPSNPLATMQDIDITDAKLFWTSTKKVRLYGIRSRRVMVDKTAVEVPTYIEHDISVERYIDSNGAETAFLFPVSTNGYIYLSNTGLVRSSLTAPSFQEDGMYLNANKDWRFVGWIKTDPSGDITHNLYCATYINPSPDSYAVTGLSGTESSGVPAKIVIPDTTVSFLMPPKSQAFIRATYALQGSTLGDTLKWWIDSTLAWSSYVYQASENIYGYGITRKENVGSSIAIESTALYMESLANAFSCDKSTIYMVVQMVPNEGEIA